MPYIEAAAEKILEALHAQSHPPGLGHVHLILLVLVALHVPDASHVPQQTEDAI